MQWGSRASLRQAPSPAIMGAVMAPWDTLRQLSFDYKIVDLGFGLGPAWDEALRYADLVLLPTQARLGEIEHLKVAVTAIERESIARPSLRGLRAEPSPPLCRYPQRPALAIVADPGCSAGGKPELSGSLHFGHGHHRLGAEFRLQCACCGETGCQRNRGTGRGARGPACAKRGLLVSANEPKSDQASRSPHERARRPRSPTRNAGPQSLDNASSARENRRVAQRHHVQKNFSGEQMWQSMEENAFDHVSWSTAREPFGTLTALRQGGEWKT